jgi:integrase
MPTAKVATGGAAAMARTVRDAKLETRTARAALKASGKPYYRAIDEGLHLGYRKGKTGGKWVFRRYIGDQSYAVETIGNADDTLDADGAIILSFAQAQSEARKRFTEAKREAAGLPATEAGPYLVRDAIADYLSWLDVHRKSGRVVRWSAEASILPELGDKQCAKLTADDIRRWMEKAAKEPARLRTKKGERQRYRQVEPEHREEETRRRRATANRKLVILKAALNMAWRAHKVPSDGAWRAVEPFPETDVARLRYLTVAECMRLINAANPDLRKMLQAALLTGCRYAELAALVAADFNPDSGTLHIRISKSGKGRHVVLTQEGIDFFSSLSAGRFPQDRLLVKDAGGRWLKSHQHRPMQEACLRARIEPPASFHVMRHTWASLTIMNGAPLMVVARNLGHVDTRMVEKHYGHLSPSYVADAIRAAAPRFGIEAGNVVPLETTIRDAG